MSGAPQVEITTLLIGLFIGTVHFITGNQRHMCVITLEYDSKVWPVSNSGCTVNVSPSEVGAEHGPARLVADIPVLHRQTSLGTN